jgi:hypothetical protein
MRFQTWRRMGLSVETETRIRNNTLTMVARERLVGRHVSAIADNPADAHYSYNLTA